MKSFIQVKKGKIILRIFHFLKKYRKINIEKNSYLRLNIEKLLFI